MIKNALKPLTKLFKDKTEIAIFFTAILAEITFGLYLVYRWGSTFESGDSISHLYIASTVVNNGAQSNLANLGTVWLPMFHILVMPLVLIEPLYRTGFAGTIVNALATGGICVILYRLLGGGKLGILASVLFMANAFTLFFGATPMMEQTAIFFMVLTAYYFKRYWEEDDLIAFMKCSLALLFGVLTRYEVWAVALLVATFFLIKELKGRRFYRLAYIHLPFWGVLAWLFWNLAIFRDPLMFLHHPMAPAKQVAGLYAPYIGNLLLITDLTFEALYTISGAIALISLTALIITASYKRWSILLSSIILTSPVAFQLFTLYTGSSGGWFRHFYPSLAGLIILPLFFTKMIPTLGNPRRKLKKTRVRPLVMLVLLLTVALYAISLPIQENILATGWVSGGGEHGDPCMPLVYEQMVKYEAVKELMDDKPILASGTTLSYQYLVILGISPSQIIDDYDGELFIKAMKEPWNFCSLVLIEASPNSSAIQAYNDLYGGIHYVYRYYNDGAWRSEFLKHYELSLELGEETVNIFKLVEGY